jgi:hypothetical protein
MTFEDAMIELVNATDARGLPVALYRGPWTADSFRDATKSFARRMGLHTDRIEFLDLNLAEPIDEAENLRLEANAWENLAKLAVATAAAVREGR